MKRTLYAPEGKFYISPTPDDGVEITNLPYTITLTADQLLVFIANLCNAHPKSPRMRAKLKQWLT